MAVSLQEQRRSRGSARGAITRVANEFKPLWDLPSDKIDISIVEKRMEVVEKAAESFEIQHMNIFEGDEDVTREQHDAELMEHLTAVNAVRELLTGLRNRSKASVLIKELCSTLEDVEKSVEREGYTSKLDPDMDQAQALSRLVLKARTQPAACDCPEISDSNDKAIARLRALQEKREVRKAPVVEAAAPVATPIHFKQGLTLDVPTFDGTMLGWRDFWETFSAVINDAPHLTDYSKRCHLIKAMGTPECLESTKNIFSFAADYNDAIKQLRSKYECNRVLHSYHYIEYHQPDVVDNKRKDLERFVTRTRKALRGFKEAKATTMEQGMTIHAQKVMTPRLLSLWKTHSDKAKETPPIEDLLLFCEKQIRSVGDDEIVRKPTQPVPKPRNAQKPPGRTVLQTQATSDKCSLCKLTHPLYSCPQYREKSPAQRHEHVKASRLCYNCLSASHRLSDCNSTGRCKTCQAKHHISIHLRRCTSSGNNGVSEDDTVNLLDRDRSAKRETTFVLPSTAVMRVRADGLCQQARAQLDSGATISLITHKLATTLKAPRLPNSSTQISGVGGVVVSPYCVQVTLLGMNDEELLLQPQVVDRIPSSSTRANVGKIHRLPFVEGLDLADPQYSSLARIDLLLDVGSANACCKEGVKFSSSPGLKAENTIFGWMVCGMDSPKNQGHQKEATWLQVSTDDDPVQVFRDLLELEQGPSVVSPLTDDETRAVQHFDETVSRDDDGRYRVSLPRKMPTPTLGKSRDCAMRRYLSNEKALGKKGEWSSFSRAVENYVELGHAEPVPLEDKQKGGESCFYMPMHAVIKPSSTSTKLRVVFDASAKTSNGVSLNDTLLPGPSLYPLLTTVLIRFRSNRITMSADISMMFREVGLNSEETDFHRYVHREESGTIQDWRMTHLTFGVTSSPFLATQVLRRLAQDYRLDFPLATRIIEHSFYVDDCLTGADTLEEAKTICEELNEVTGKGCMTLRKWRSDSPTLLSTIPEQLRETSDLLIASPPSTCSKALGLHWNTATDCLHVATPEVKADVPVTKRRVASAIARIFDVLGWFSPATIPAKIILQQSWALKLGWDDPLPLDMQADWKSWVAELPTITTHPVSRYLGLKEGVIVSRQIHGFSDASTKAYGGVVYIRTFFNDLFFSTDLIVSKARVAPLKETTVPRLELCGALLLAQLLKKVMDDLDISADSVFAWSDSAVVLGWLNKPPGRLATFIANRVMNISALVDPRHWRYVSTSCNPADLLSRGVLAKELCTRDLWWKGPPWLRLDPECWPHGPDINCERELPELRKTVLSVKPLPEEFGNNCSSFDRLVRVVAWMNRFCLRAKGKQKGVFSMYISISEYRLAKLKLLKYSQRYIYPTECQLLEERRPLPVGHSLSSLSPYLDEDRLMRVGGRLQKASLSSSSSHPIILSVRSRVVTLMVEHTHRMLLHAGPSTVMATLAHTYHLPRIKKLLRKLSRSCVQCQKVYARTSSQLMGELPAVRTQPARPFSIVGLDFAGPVMVKRGKPRRPDKVKHYICVFICFISRATHLEIVSDLTTSAFLSALTRFVSRRGCPSKIYSDNGSNFIGAQAELQHMTELLRTEESQQEVSHWASRKDIAWSFSPARAPHFGGLWEAAVGAMKRILRKTIGDHTLAYEDLLTVVAEAEAILNSRPLIPQDSPAEDAIAPLTPGHFLIGSPLAALPFLPDTSTKLTTLKHWNLTERLRHDLWQRWRTEYLLLLQKRNKWRKPNRNFCVDDLVLIKDSDSFLRSWPMARVIRTYPGTDGCVRVVDIWSRGKIWRRATHKLVHLPVEDEDVSPRGEDVQV